MDKRTKLYREVEAGQLGKAEAARELGVSRQAVHDALRRGAWKNGPALAAQRRPVERCMDGGECELVGRGLPRCTGHCPIHRARFSGAWKHITSAADAGNDNAAKIVRRAQNALARN